MKNESYRMTLLYDFYGELLTPRQQEFFDLYYNEDLSLAEIAENFSITRQGVRDVIVRAESILENMEDKTGIIRRFHTLQDQLSSVNEIHDQMVELNDNTLMSEQLDALLKDESVYLEQMKE